MNLSFRKSRRRDAVLLLTVLGLVALAGCAAGDKTLVEVDPEAAPLEPTYQQVVAILDRSCVPCHSGGERDDGGSYDTCEGIEADLGGILRTAVDEGSMPPGAWPRLTETERLVLRRWVANGACSPCKNCP